jgi:hypothetical protein
MKSGIEINEHIEGDGADIFRAACRLGHEGIVAKRKDLPYESGEASASLSLTFARCSRRSRKNRARTSQSIFVNLRNDSSVRHVTEAGRGELSDQAAATAAAAVRTDKVR